jgi:hypothetical protein
MVCEDASLETYKLYRPTLDFVEGHGLMLKDTGASSSASPVRCVDAGN